MAVNFLSPQWKDEMTAKLEEEFCTKGKVTTTFAQIVTNTPDDVQRWMVLSLEKGKFVSYEVGEGEVPKSELSATATYNTFSRVIKGELDGAQGIMSGDFKLGGNVLKAMGLLGTYNRLEEVQRSIETEF